EVGLSYLVVDNVPVVARHHRLDDLGNDGVLYLLSRERPDCGKGVPDGDDLKFRSCLQLSREDRGLHEARDARECGEGVVLEVMDVRSGMTRLGHAFPVSLDHLPTS